MVASRLHALACAGQSHKRQLVWLTNSARQTQSKSNNQPLWSHAGVGADPEQRWIRSCLLLQPYSRFICSCLQSFKSLLWTWQEFLKVKCYKMFLLVAHVTVEQGQIIQLPIHRTYIPNKRLRSYNFTAQLKYNALVQQGTYTWIELICVFKSDNPENVCEHRGHLYGTWCDVACFWSWTAVVKVLEHREHVFVCLFFLPVAASS